MVCQLREVIKIPYHEYDSSGLPDYGTGAFIITSYDLFPDQCIEDCYLDECWSPIDAAQNYWVSDMGRVYSFKSNKFLKEKKLDNHGHVGFAFSFDGETKPRYLYLHRLMAESFIPEEENTYLVRHLDDTPDNNVLENLAWGTKTDNVQDMIRNGHAHFVTPEEREIGLSKVRKPTRATNLKTGEAREYISLNEAVRDLGVQQSNAQKVASGRRPHTCGWKFEYIEED